MQDNKKTKNYVEQRDGLRAERSLAVRHRLVRQGRKIVDGAWSRSETSNMSVSGLLFVSPVEYKVADRIELEIVLTEMIEIYSGLAEVLRVSHLPGGGYQIAVKYIDDRKRSRPARRHL